MARPKEISKTQLQQRRQQALELKLAGYTYRQIGDFLGVSAPVAHSDVEILMREYATAPATEVRDQELARLDKMLAAYWDKALSGDYSAVSVVLKVMDRRAKLLGLDAPQKVNITQYITEMALREGIDPKIALEQATAVVEAAGF